MRSDEEFVKDSIVRYHSTQNNVEAQPGEDPPDYYIKIDQKTVALEVSRLTPISYDENGNINNRVTQDEFALRICDDLNKRFSEHITSDSFVLLHLTVPVNNPRKYKLKLFDLLEKIIKENNLTNDWMHLDIEGSPVSLKLGTSRPNSEGKIFGFVSNKNSSAHILSNAKVILQSRIEDKNRRYKELSLNMPHWLGLLNDYWLSDSETYERAYDELKLDHNFQRIYIVSDRGDVALIYERT